ncbi:serine/threonine-protein kinase/endoribonuclease IRE1 [Typha angustifolia]|uniref:serine/threonine-protein kinase/endoribonuclease IRE1 n=1 Tax=Typha angustifolia TaxID=59011 RepID=UPI003C2CE1AD
MSSRPFLLVLFLLAGLFFYGVQIPSKSELEEAGERWGSSRFPSPLPLLPSALSVRARKSKLEAESRKGNYSTNLVPVDELSHSVVSFPASLGRSPGARSLLEVNSVRPDTFLRVNDDGIIELVDSKSHTTLWELSTGYPLLSFYPSDSEYLVYPGYATDSDLYEFIKGFGSRKHALTIEKYVARTPHIEGSVVTVGSKTSTMYTVNADNGELVCKHDLVSSSTGSKVPSENTALPPKFEMVISSEDDNYLTVIRTDYSLSSSDLGRHLWNLTKSFVDVYYHKRFKLQGIGNRLEPSFQYQGKIPVHIQSRGDKQKIPLIYSHNSISMREKNQAVIHQNEILEESLSLEPYAGTNEYSRMSENMDDSVLDNNDDVYRNGDNEFNPVNMVDGYQSNLVSSENSFKHAISTGQYFAKRSAEFIYGSFAWLVIPFFVILTALLYLHLREPVKDVEQLTEVPKKKKARKAGEVKDGVVLRSDTKLSSSDMENSETDKLMHSQNNERYPFKKFMQPNDAGDGRWVGKLFVSNTEIGRGSNGTIVLEGFYDGRPVAVKRLLRAHHDVAFKEIHNLIASDHHPNIVRFYGVEQDLDFIYISLERCSCSLADLIQLCSCLPLLSTSPETPTPNSVSERRVPCNCLDSIGKDIQLWRADGLPSTQLLKVMRDVVSGLAHLHELGIIHRDLKPQNVLITNEGSIKAKVSDMGISKRLLEDMSSLSHHATGCGSSGWQAPEQLLHGRQTRALDLFSLGCILFYCITKGGHPFGSYFNRDSNIIESRFDLFCVDHIPEAVDLLSQLFDPDPQIRPKAVEVLHHPLFWSSEMRLSFLRETSDRVDKSIESELLNALEHAAPLAFGGKWNEKLDAALLADTSRYRKYNFHCTRDLLRLIRNISNHYRELPSELQEILGSLPEGFDRYFSSRFPKLLIEVYKVISKYCREEDCFTKYFKSSLL